MLKEKTVLTPPSGPEGWNTLTNEHVPSRTSEGVAHAIRKAIFARELKPGDSIRERTLAAQLQISRTPVREALFILQGEGLVELTHNRGARVAHITTHEMRQIYALRGVLEGFAAKSAAENATPEQIQKIAEALERQKRLPVSASPMEQAQADLAFHEAIAAASGLQLLLTVSHQVLSVTVTHRARETYSAERIKRVHKQHTAVLKAIQNGDAQLAESLMGEHVSDSAQRVEID